MERTLNLDLFAVTALAPSEINEKVLQASQQQIQLNIFQMLNISIS